MEGWNNTLVQDEQKYLLLGFKKKKTLPESFCIAKVTFNKFRMPTNRKRNGKKIFVGDENENPKKKNYEVTAIHRFLGQ